MQILYLQHSNNETIFSAPNLSLSFRSFIYLIGLMWPVFRVETSFRNIKFKLMDVCNMTCCFIDKKLALARSLLY